MKWESRRSAGNRRGGTGRQTITIRDHTTPRTIPAPSRATLTDNALDAHGTRLACPAERLRLLAWRWGHGALARNAQAADDVATRWHAAIERRPELLDELAHADHAIASMYHGTWAPAIALRVLLDALERDDNDDDTEWVEPDAASAGLPRVGGGV